MTIGEIARLAAMVARRDIEHSILLRAGKEANSPQWGDVLQIFADAWRETEVVSVHPIDYQTKIAIRVGDDVVDMPIAWARKLHQILGAELAAIDAGFVSSATRATNAQQNT